MQAHLHFQSWPGKRGCDLRSSGHSATWRNHSHLSCIQHIAQRVHLDLGKYKLCCNTPQDISPIVTNIWNAKKKNTNTHTHRVHETLTAIKIFLQYNQKVAHDNKQQFVWQSYLSIPGGFFSKLCQSLFFASCLFLPILTTLKDVYQCEDDTSKFLFWDDRCRIQCKIPSPSTRRIFKTEKMTSQNVVQCIKNSSEWDKTVFWMCINKVWCLVWVGKKLFIACL